MQERPDRPGTAWPPTQWTLVCRCGALPPGRRREELGRLVALYHAPIESALARILANRGVPWARAGQWAEELAAQFVADRLVAGDLLARIDRNGPARFKTFLWKCLTDWATDALRRAGRGERARRAAPVAGDPFADAARGFERTLALQDLREALRETRDHCRAKGWDAVFGAFCEAFMAGRAPDPAIPARTWRDRCARIRAHLRDALRRRVSAACLDRDEADRELARVEDLLLDLRGVRWSVLLEDGDLWVEDREVVPGAHPG